MAGNVEFGFPRVSTQRTLDSFIPGVAVHVVFQIESEFVFKVALGTFVPALLMRIHRLIIHSLESNDLL